MPRLVRGRSDHASGRIASTVRAGAPAPRTDISAQVSSRYDNVTGAITASAGACVENLSGAGGDEMSTVGAVSVLSELEVASFVRDGFVRLEGAFPAAVARRCVDDLWALLDEDRCDRSTWINPVARVTGTRSDALDAAINTDRLCGAIDDLVGAGRWQRRQAGYGSFPIRFPSDVDPGDAGWHIDGSYEVGKRPPPWNYWVNHRSRGRALLLLMLFSEVTERDAPTRVRVGSHVDVARVLPMFGEAGGSFVDVTQAAHHAEGRRDVLATGAAGDVYLCHPFIVHTASWPHRGQSPRFIGQPPIEFVPGRDGYEYDDARLDRSPCAEAIRRAQPAAERGRIERSRSPAGETAEGAPAGRRSR